MLVANSLRDAGAGFGTDTNVATLLFADGRRETPPLMSKEALAAMIGTAARDAAGAGVTARGDGMRVPASRISGA